MSMTERQQTLLAAHLANPSLLLKKYELILEATDPLSILYRWFGDSAGQYWQAAAELTERHQTLGIKTLFIRTTEYPALLSECAAAPPVLFYKGNLKLLQTLTVSIVGTRKPSLVGLKYTEAISQYLAKRYATIVSGMARGIDSRSHRSALAVGGATIGVVAHGLDRIYPAEHHDIFARAMPDSSVLLLTEYPAGMPPLKHHFVKRNRIIAGLSNTLIMAEGSETSGAMITARYAIDNHRNVFAIDHPAMSANTGGKRLISQGAENLAERFALQEISLQNLAQSNDTIEPFYLGSKRWATIVPVQQELFQEDL